MTSPLFPLEDFDAATRADPPVTQTPQEIEAARIAAYDQGYKAGWDDAASAQADDQSRIDATFSRNLEDLGFTFHEARSHVMRSIGPLLHTIMEKVLPDLIMQTIGQTILEELLPMAENASDTPIEIVISPANRTALETVLQRTTTIPIRIAEETNLTDGQVYLRMGESERQIDLTGTVERISQAIQAVYTLNESALKHG
ncbi:MAG: flagellar biosynthesis protein [Paracoccaceae bacterium]